MVAAAGRSPYANTDHRYGYVLERFPVSLPHSVHLEEDVDLAKIAADALVKLPELGEDSLGSQPVWRDSMALTGTFRTLYTPSRISRIWNELVSLRQAANFELCDPPATVTRIPGVSASWVTVNFIFQTASAPRASSHGSLALSRSTTTGGWVIWMINTVLDQLVGHPSVDHLAPSEVRIALKKGEDEVDGHDGVLQSFDVVVIGAGQAGLSVAGRLKALGVNYVVVDRMHEVGDNWRLRYDSTRLHTTREFAHLPFERTFPSHYPEYLTKDDVAKGFAHWAEKYHINLWLSTGLVSGKWDAKREWYELTLDRNGHLKKVNCRHVVMATGGYGSNLVYPQYDDRDIFRGAVMHSEEYQNPSQWKGRNGVVVGSANTAHDIAADMLRAGLISVYLVQRERTYVVPATHFKKFADRLYNAHTPTEVADRISYSQPWAISRLYSQGVLHPLAAQEAPRYEALEQAGFRVTQYGDLVYNLSVRRGGHYMDVGCSELISKGLVKVQSGALPVRYTSDGLICSDGTFLPADVVIFATGFSGSLTDGVANIFGQDVADRMGAFWGLDQEGEIRGAFKPTNQLGMWAAAGTIAHCRWHSRFIALQIKAQLDGNSFPVYRES